MEQDLTSGFAFLTLLITFAPFIGWILLAIITSIAAHNRGRDVAGWFCLSLFLMGPFALICVLVMRPNQKVLDADALKNKTMQQCGACAELIKIEATICRYCGTDINIIGPRREPNRLEET